MQHEPDSFEDTELTQMANDIMLDWLKPILDPNNSYSLTTDEENDESHETLDVAALPSLAHLNPASVHAPSRYRVRESPPKAPCIIDRTPLLASDSLHRSFPDIPTMELSHVQTAHASASKHQKKGVFKSAFMIPPGIIVSEDGSISGSMSGSMSAELSVLSPRRRSNRNNVSPIPDFTEHDTKISKNKKPTEHKARRKRKAKKKKKSKKYRVKTIKSPVVMDKDYAFRIQDSHKQRDHDRVRSAPPTSAVVIDKDYTFRIPRQSSSVALSMIIE